MWWKKKCKGLNITEEDKRFIADFYKYGFVGIMLEWIREGMKENIEDLVRMMDLTLHDTVTTSIHNFQQKYYWQKKYRKYNHVKILYKSRRVMKKTYHSAAFVNCRIIFLLLIYSHSNKQIIQTDEMLMIWETYR